MNKEEKKSIDYFKNKIADFELVWGKKLKTQENEHIKTLLNLIKKQQKEIAGLKKIVKENKPMLYRVINKPFKTTITREELDNWIDKPTPIIERKKK